MGFAVASGVFVGMRGAGDSGCSGEGSVVRLIILWILSRVKVLVIWEWLCGFWGETAAGLPGGFKMTETKRRASRIFSPKHYLLAVLSGLPAAWRRCGGSTVGHTGVSLWVSCYKASQTKLLGVSIRKSST